jgi:hypothetical protein
LGQVISPEQANREHIVPLSLGGANGFEIFVDRDFNSTVGSKIDGALANDFMVAMKRQEYDAIGHSKKRPAVVSKRSKMNDNGMPVQVSLDRKNGMAIWDSVGRRYLTDKESAGRSISTQFAIERWSRLKFAAKVALGSGYFIYGDQFIKKVNHDEIRTIMNMTGQETKNDFESIKTRIYDQFSGPEEKDKNEFKVQEFLCNFVNGSCVITIPGPRNVQFTVGVLGLFTGMLNVPAKTSEFPLDGDHDLGHAVVLQKGKIYRMSYQALLQRAQDYIGNKMKG